MLNDDIVEKFKQRLVSREIEPGAFLTLREISNSLGISVGKTRELAQRLELEGFLHVHAQRGVQVRDITVKSTYAAFGFRSIMEEAAIVGFAQDGPDHKINDLIERTNALKENDPGSLEFANEVAIIDWEMHLAIIKHVKNSFLSQAYKVNATHISWIRANATISAQRHLDVLREHLAILEACRSRDINAALASLKVHINNSLQQALQG